MGKQRREQPQDSIFADNSFLDGLFEWMDSPEGQKSIAVRDVLRSLLEDAQLDAKQRKLIWPDAERLDLEQSIQRVQKKYPDFPRDEVEEFLLDWVDSYDPENYSQAQLDELDSLTERWVADHLRMAKASKNRRELVTLEKDDPAEYRPSHAIGRERHSNSRNRTGIAHDCYHVL
jgi:hypothetical protein